MMEIVEVEGVKIVDETGQGPEYAPFKLEKFDHEKPTPGFRTVARKTALAATDGELANGLVTFLSRRRKPNGRVKKKSDCGRHIAYQTTADAIIIMHATKGYRVKGLGGTHTQHQKQVTARAEGFLQFIRGHA